MSSPDPASPAVPTYAVPTHAVPAVPAAPEMVAFVAALPKVELHLHLVGSASLDTVLALARRHAGRGVPTELGALREFYAFTDFPHFLEVYRRVNLLVNTGADVITLLDGLAAELAARTVRYAEVQVTPVRNGMAGISYDDLAQALVDGRALARRRHGVELGWVFDADAALGPDGAEQTVDFALGHRPEGTVGIGLGGAEVGVRRADFAPAFRRARDAGLHSVPHAGETVGPGEVWSAITELGAERVGHGIGSAADPRLLEELASRGITLEVCPTSNLRTAAVASLAEHPLPTLLAAGVPVTLATDDPGMFHTDLNTEYLRCHQLFGLGRAELADIARTGARAAFCADDLRTRILTEIDQLQPA
ncbi:MAG: adenosine deaminase [Pseudonocardia sp.]|nr:adenosine deaminase [Pseudonocardia sp.]